ncbi:hypothetical protein J2TS6_34690 [Paenibacillus albilobatus]|uniref:Uncharacterized protein n=1 Tax=Paenibacillus albilobatus TaxID=2716884 RepID=A0A919XLC5_9BACL|nr:hypothetical protein [Paenibacillus albilobatus]GIO32328.1 hypothetical protein J2TS6_34690 [Paenibacillus albilobatus]
MLTMIAYTASMLLYVGIMIYRMAAKTFSRFFREEVGFVFIFLILSVSVRVPIAIRAIYLSAVLLTFVIGYIKNGNMPRE